MPVHNAASNLTHRLQRILEILPDMATHFELHIVDDGSTDATLEVADDLAREYPQIRVSRNARPMGVEQAARHAAARLGYPVLIVDNDRALPRAADLFGVA
jgi:glycosyltransferase involved in cell wall biosynthesis